MLTIANQGREGVKKHEKHANVICERPPNSNGPRRYLLNNGNTSV